MSAQSYLLFIWGGFLIIYVIDARQVLRGLKGPVCGPRPQRKHLINLLDDFFAEVACKLITIGDALLRIPG